MATPTWLDLGMQHLSESMFMGLSDKVGCLQTVIMRREMADILEMIINKVIITREARREMVSGSHREGFRLEGSDVNAMCWRNNHTVIWDIIQAQHYDLSRKTLLLCDCTVSQPGFALLELLTHTESLQNACIRINDRIYVSSSKYRQVTFSEVPSFLNPTEHGPCARAVIEGEAENDGVEYNVAQCFVCDFWPPSASKWIDRCHSWPPSYIVDDIVRSGCHFVAIGNKLGNHANIEWRISFSLAEQKLFYSMNHCQFLTYGLLKLFLKNCINNGLYNEEKLLCAYHMKTAVFWAIQQNLIPQWCPQNLLHCFWICFKLILKWVYEGVCPNFFIPENNMFRSKIHGEAQKKLFIRVYKLYEKGIVSVLHMPFIRSHLKSVLRLGDKYKHMLSSMVLFELDLFSELHSNNIPTPDLHRCMRFLNTAEKLIILPLTQYQVLVLQRYTAPVLQSSAFMSHRLLTLIASRKVNTSSVVNKKVYMANKASTYMLKLASKFGCISDMLFLAMFYYKTLRYKEAISVIEMTKVKLAQPYVMYVKHVTVDAMQFLVPKILEGQSWSTKMKQAVSWDFLFNNTVCYMNELVPEQQSALQCRDIALLIPLYVLLHMLEILCYRYVDPLRAQSSLYELQDLVHHDRGKYIQTHKRDISWQILGICQQVTGNYQAALYSYQQSLRQEPNNNIQTATSMRIQEIMAIIYNNQ